MIDRRQRRIDSVDRYHVGSGGARDNGNLDPQVARSLDLGVGGRPAAVLGNDGVDAMLLEQGDFVFEIEGATIEDVVDVRNGDLRRDRIDAADKIEMLRRRLGTAGFLPAGCKKDATGRGSQSSDRLGNARRWNPHVARLWRPFGSLQGEDGNVSDTGRHGGICRNPGGKGMRRVDQQIKLPLPQKAAQALDAAETADANRNGLNGGIFRTAGEREQNLVPAARRKCLREFARLRGSTEDQNADLSHV